MNDGDEDRDPPQPAPPEQARASRASIRPSGPSRPPRPSRPPHTPHPLLGAGRVLFALAWLGLQGALVLTADRRADGAFGFRTFGESSTVRLTLYREIAREGGARERVHVTGGAWDARDAGGLVRRVAWDERVKSPDLATFDLDVRAPYGARAELWRLQAALDDVAAHIPEDAETRRLVLEVTIRQAGRDPQTTRLASAERGGAGGS